MKGERDTLNTDQTQYFQQKTQIELRLRDLRQELDNEVNTRVCCFVAKASYASICIFIALQADAETELDKLKAEIASKTTRRDEIAPRLQQALQRENELDTQSVLVHLMAAVSSSRMQDQNFGRAAPRVVHQAGCQRSLR